MSKIIETLKASSMEHKKKGPDASIDPRKKMTSHEMTQEQLADIYFAGSEKLVKSEYPTVIRVTEKPSSVSWLPWGVALATVLIAVFLLISGHRVFVDIRVMNERAASLNVLPESSDTSQEVTTESPKVLAPTDKQENVLHLGDNVPLQDFSFEGAAKLKSSKESTSLTLVNSSVAPFARAILRFDTPMNLAGSKVVFYAKGNRGGENIAFALKDKENISAFNKNKIYPFPGSLTTDWQRAEIPMSNTSKEFDVRSVTSLRFEFGSKDTENKPGDTIVVKDLQVVPL
jgi:hypothetical protein